MPEENKEELLEKTSIYAASNDNELKIFDINLSGKTLYHNFKIDICEKIGSGATAEVYRGKKITGIEKIVAIKFSNRKKESLENLRTEANLSAKLKHDYIVSIDSYYEHDERGIIIMDFVEGDNLSKILNDHKNLELRFPEKFAGLIGWLCCEALEYAHNTGVIHRDISLKNIMISSENGSPKILDFGIGILSSENRYVLEQMVGTIGFIAPEIIEGKKVDKRADIYSLGNVLDFMVRGVNPYLEKIIENKPSEIIKKMLESYVDYSPLKNIESIDKEFSDIVEKAVKPNPDDRYQSASEMLNDLTKYLYQKDQYGPTRPVLKLYLDIIKKIQEAKSKMPYLIRDGKLSLKSLSETPFIKIG